jgi:hypothetical protein
MAEIPSSYGLKKRKRPDGALELVQKCADGTEDVARVCYSGEVTEEDLQEMQVGDREKSTSRDFGMHFMRQCVQSKQQFEEKMLDDYMEPAMQVAHAGLHKGDRTLGYSRSYAHNFDRIDWSN